MGSERGGVVGRGKPERVSSLEVGTRSELAGLEPDVRTTDH